MITFIEDSVSGYKHRTYENARQSDATIAFAANFNTSGEIMTKNATEMYGKIYSQIRINGTNSEFNEDCNNTIKMLKENNCHTINVAGNGLSRLHKYGITQEKCDIYVLTFIEMCIENEVEIQEIRSGGQTGADESGLKAAEKLGINSVCLFPKGWRFRTETEDIFNEELFKKRFDNGNI